MVVEVHSSPLWYTRRKFYRQSRITQLFSQLRDRHWPEQKPIFEWRAIRNPVDPADCGVFEWLVETSLVESVKDILWDFKERESTAIERYNLRWNIRPPREDELAEVELSARISPLAGQYSCVVAARRQGILPEYSYESLDVETSFGNISLLSQPRAPTTQTHRDLPMMKISLKEANFPNRHSFMAEVNRELMIMELVFGVLDIAPKVVDKPWTHRGGDEH